MSETSVVHGPHAHAGPSLRRMMLEVILALLPATLYGFSQYGWPALFLFLTCILCGLIIEALCLRLQKRPLRALGDGSALLSCWLLALSLPPWAPWWVALVGALLAIALVKQLFGGLGQNLFNPAMAARVILLIAFPVEMTRWVQPLALGSLPAPGFLESLQITFGGAQTDAYSSATLLGHVKTELSRGTLLSDALADIYRPLQALLGERAGSMGESSSLLLALGGCFLLARRVITWQAPLGLTLGLALPALVMYLIDPLRYASPLYHLLSGGFMLTLWFIVTDPVTCPASAAGRLLFGLLCGVLIYLIRTYGSYPEAVAFALLLMNAATPLIDRYLRPRIYGRNRQGAALQPFKRRAP